MDDSNKGDPTGNLIDLVVSLPSEHKTIEIKRLNAKAREITDTIQTAKMSAMLNK